MTDQEQPLTHQPAPDAGPVSRTTTRWLYPALAVTGIAVGVFIIAAGFYLLFAPASWHPSWHTAHTAQTSCCATMGADMAKMRADMANGMTSMKDEMKDMPCMAAMHSMPSMSPTPPTPAR